MLQCRPFNPIVRNQEGFREGFGEEEHKGAVPVDSVVRGGGEARGVVVEAAVEHGRAVRELALEHVGGGVVEAHLGVPRRDEQVVAVVGEPEVGDAVRRRVRELPAQQRQRQRRRRGRHRRPPLVVVLLLLRRRRGRHPCSHHPPHNHQSLQPNNQSLQPNNQPAHSLVPMCE
jgi:hypothetical protein